MWYRSFYWTNDDKSNEITAIPDLLDLIDVKGKIITIDAIGTQEEIANKIVYEKRTYYISYDTNCIHNKKKWKSVKAIGRMDVYREENGKNTVTKNYYILSQQFPIERFKKITRQHWNIECSFHWRLDVILDEDHSTSKKDNSIDNLVIIRKIVFNLASLDTSMENPTLKKKLTLYSFDFKNIENLIFNVIPSI